ncbi:hypothetical protein SQ11_10275 [Nitrosospira sp. NpAV]|nr:hypothetical protein SQ11_10275 [Nitrosospira sp. NpAV]
MGGVETEKQLAPVPVAFWLSPHKPPSQTNGGIDGGMAQQEWARAEAGVAGVKLPPAGIAESIPVHRP